MRVVTAGGHGKIAQLTHRELAGRGDTAVGLIRNPDHAAALRAAGAHPVVADLEHVGVDELADHLHGADAVLFAAGAGPGSGAARKDTVDRAAAVLLADAAERADVRRYLLLSSVGVEGEAPAGTDEVFAAYLRAKKAAEDDLTGRDLDWTILRPGRLTDDPPTGRITLTRHAPAGAAVTRTDVARVLVALLYHPGTAGRILELVDGDTTIADAIAAVDRR
ncbi:SDR family oxidoreductase [Micromonospora peucetia]|uniref:Nucleoside-diphosphate-sugar epimerase n=1 Tax=Micromonospora peucetia TaxID=47871 RepID=A0A1C6W2T9_9ACTN|nr:NAD(P)H-binding protein [Micromonospora peucetia]MCX4391042.1 SDR family oxidoreductase [Micromonospora peucetia]SCL72480.1 Nucleoside-diphosphate-sugar epimerase [Micromonospora peucetia]